MNKLIIATHGYMAKGIKSALAIIAGDVSKVIDINAFTEECPNLDQRVAELLSQYQDDEILVLTDVYFGGVNQAFMRAQRDRAFPLATGVNLPLAMELYHSIGEKLSLEEIAEIAALSGSACQLVRQAHPSAQAGDAEEEL